MLSSLFFLCFVLFLGHPRRTTWIEWRKGKKNICGIILNPIQFYFETLKAAVYEVCRLYCLIITHPKTMYISGILQLLLWLLFLVPLFLSQGDSGTPGKDGEPGDPVSTGCVQITVLFYSHLVMLVS